MSLNLATVDNALLFCPENKRREALPLLQDIYHAISALTGNTRTQALCCLANNERLWAFEERDPALEVIVTKILEARRILGTTLYDVLRNLEAIFANPPRVTVVGDREVSNLRTLIHHGNHHPGVLSIGGLVVPARDVDDYVIDTFDQMHGMRTQGVAQSILSGSDDVAEEQEDNGDLHFTGPFTDARFLHVPYDAARLKAEGPSYRRAYCEKLLAALKFTHPDLVFLSNFKLILDRIVAEAFEGRIVNVHPSVLPHLKGWRTEHRAANLGEHPDFHGYTMHHVNTTLDGGATLFQQRVPFAAYDHEIATRIGQTPYETMREEISRQAIILQQAVFVGEVLGLVLSRTERIVVNDAEAFEVEGRPGFEEDSGYIADLHKEYEAWMKNTGNNASYEEWYAKHRPPYQRVLFDHEGSWKTAESILDAPSSASLLSLEPRRRYTVRITGTNQEVFSRWGMISTHAQEGSPGATRPVYSSVVYNDGILTGIIDACTDLEPVLKKDGIDFTVESLSVRATAKRRNVDTQAAV